MTASTRQVIFFMSYFSTRLRRYQQGSLLCFLARSYVEVMYSQAGFGYHNGPQRLSRVVSSATIKLSLRDGHEGIFYLSVSPAVTPFITLRRKL